jgi:hypothetical protein
MTMTTHKDIQNAKENKNHTLFSLAKLLFYKIYTIGDKLWIKFSSNEN